MNSTKLLWDTLISMLLSNARPQDLGTMYESRMEAWQAIGDQLLIPLATANATMLCSNPALVICESIDHHPPTNSQESLLYEQLATSIENIHKCMQLWDGDQPWHNKQIRLLYDRCTSNDGADLGDRIKGVLADLGGWPMVDWRRTWSSYDVDIGLMLGRLYSVFGVAPILEPGLGAFGPAAMPKYTDPTSTILYMKLNRDDDIDSIDEIVHWAKTVAHLTGIVGEADIVDSRLVFDAGDIVDIEKMIAYFTQVDDNRMMFENFDANLLNASTAERRWPLFNWRSYMHGMADGVVPAIDLINSQYYINDIHIVDMVLASLSLVPKHQLRNYLMWKVIKTSLLPHIKGDIWRQRSKVGCVEMIAKAMPFAIGRLYIDSSMAGELASFDGLVSIVDTVMRTYRRMVEDSVAISMGRKRSMLAKLHRMQLDFAYPQWMMNDEALSALYTKERIDISSNDDSIELAIKVQRLKIWWHLSKLSPSYKGALYGWLRHDIAPLSSKPIYYPWINTLVVPIGIINDPSIYNHSYPIAANYAGAALRIATAMTDAFLEPGVVFNENNILTEVNFGRDILSVANDNECIGRISTDVCSNAEYNHCRQRVAARTIGIQAAYQAYNDRITRVGPEPDFAQTLGHNFTMNQLFFIWLQKGLCQIDNQKEVKDNIALAMNSYFNAAFHCNAFHCLPII